MSPFSMRSSSMRQVMLDRRLRHAEREAAVDRRTHRDLVEKPAVNADDRDHAEVAAAMDRLAQHVRSVRSDEGRDLHPIEHRIERSRSLRARCRPRRCRRRRRGLSSAPGCARRCPPSGNRSFPRRRSCASASRSGTVSMAMTRSAPSRKALRMANCPTGPQPQMAIVSPRCDVAEIRGHVPGRENVRQEQHLLVAIRHAVCECSGRYILKGRPHPEGAPADSPICDIALYRNERRDWPATPSDDGGSGRSSAASSRCGSRCAPPRLSDSLPLVSNDPTESSTYVVEGGLRFPRARRSLRDVPPTLRLFPATRQRRPAGRLS